MAITSSGSNATATALDALSFGAARTTYQGADDLTIALPAGASRT